MRDVTVKCDRCRADCVPEGGAAGYGVTRDGARLCYQCCADDTRAAMARGEPVTLYATDDGRVTDWPGRLVFQATTKTSPRGGGFGARRMDVWFSAEGRRWHGAVRGDMQCFTARPLKA